MKEKISLKKRRGLHTIVGAVFFVLVMGSTIGYVTYSMDLVDNLAYQLDAKQDANLNRESEKMIITDVRIDNNEFNLTVRNTGTLPINVTKMWVKNMTDSTWNQTAYQVNQLISPGGTLSNVGQGTGLAAMDSQSYSLKLLTTRGNALETQVYSTSNLPLEMSLITNPVNPMTGQDVTVQFLVKNNLTNGATIQSITPQIDFNDGTADTVTLISGATPPFVEGLGPGDIAVFEWTFDVVGDEGETAIFNATIANAVVGNFVTDTSTVSIAPLAQEAVQSAIAGAFGEIFLNFRSFEACDPVADNCKPNTSGWKPVWELEGDSQLLYRVDLENQGDFAFCLEKRTALVMIASKDDGTSGDQRPYFMRDPSTAQDEDPGAYSVNYSECIQPSSTLKVYFGSQKVDLDTKTKVFDADGIQNIIVTVFAAEDTNGDGDYDAGEPEYSQSLPFLGSGICKKTTC